MKKPAIQQLLQALLLCAAVLACLTYFGRALAADDNESQSPDLADLARHNEELKQQAIDFNRDLLLLEDAAVPANRRITVFISQSHDLTSTMDSVDIQIDPDVSVQHKYSSEEGSALQKGGAQRLYMGAIPAGRHVINVSLSAVDASGSVQHYSSKLSFRSGQEPKTLEIELQGGGSEEAEVSIHESN